MLAPFGVDLPGRGAGEHRVGARASTIPRRRPIMGQAYPGREGNSTVFVMGRGLGPGGVVGIQVALDADPGHLPAVDDLPLADQAHIVFRIAGCGTGTTADTF